MKRQIIALLLIIGWSFTAQPAQTVTKSKPVVGDERIEDRAAVRAVVDRIFRAFIEKNAATLKSTHSDDWAGYFTNSRELTQGGDGYMKRVMPNLNAKDAGMLSYTFEEFTINFQGDIALVFYVADIVGKNALGTGKDKYRSLDVYAKRGGNWVQIASNLARHPDAVADQTSRPNRIDPNLKQRILDARQDIWRAWFTNDQEKLAKLLPDEALAFQTDGNWLTKSEVLAGAKRFADTGETLISLAFPRTEIQMYGSVITLYSSYIVETALNGNRVTRTGLGTETFVLRNNEILRTGWMLKPM